MAIGTGSHWSGPLYGSDNAGGGLYDDLPIEIQNRRFRSYVFYDFTDLLQDDTGATNLWTTTALVASTAPAIITSPVNNGGFLRVTSDGVDAQGLGSFQTSVSTMLVSTAAQADGTSKRVISMGTRLKVSDWSASDWFWGLADFDTTLMGTTGLLLTTGADNFVGFHHIVDAVAQGGITGPDGNDVRLASAGTAVANYQATLLSAAQVPKAVPTDAAIDGVVVELGLRLIGNNVVEYYVDGRLRHRRLMSNAFAASLTLCPSFAHVSNGSTVNMDVDYVWWCTTR